MYKLEFITGLPPPLQKEEPKLKPNAQFDYPTVWLKGATGTSFCGPCETQMSTGPWQQTQLPGFPKLQFMTHTVTHVKSCVESSGQEQELSAADTCAPSCCSDRQENYCHWLLETAFEHFCFSSVFKKKTLSFEIPQKRMFSMMFHR